MRFPYQARPVRQAVYPLSGSRLRYYPLIPGILSGPNGGWMRDCLLDSGADDTLFPEAAAVAVGIDLSGAPTTSATQAAGAVVQYAYASVTLRISDGKETCEWSTIIGFTKSALRWPILGQTGFLQFFDATLFGMRHEVILTPNSAFAGRYITH